MTTICCPLMLTENLQIMTIPTPHSSDNVIKISGRVMTAQVGRLSDGNGDNFNPDGKEIIRYKV
jgi:hypothetical protein